MPPLPARPTSGGDPLEHLLRQVGEETMARMSQRPLRPLSLPPMAAQSENEAVGPASHTASHGLVRLARMLVQAPSGWPDALGAATLALGIACFVATFTGLPQAAGRWPTARPPVRCSSPILRP